MPKIVWGTLLNSPFLLAATLLVANSAIAAETPVNTGVSSESNVSSLDQIQQYSEQSDAMDQVTSVSQLRDVQPTDWAFQALQSLVERYGCIAGYPDGTYRGNRAMTRYEFAAGLNACMDKVGQLIASSTANFVTKDDLATLQKLQEQFAAELATLRGRVDALEARTAELESNQFSTTTKLRGEAIFALASLYGDRLAVASGSTRAARNSLQDNPVLDERVRLNFDTSFSGKDLLRTRLQARNIIPFSGSLSGTNMTRLGFDGDNQNQFTLDKLYYRFPLGKGTTIQLDATNGELNDNVNVFNPAFQSSGAGAISRFGRYNPIFRQIGATNTNGVATGGAALTIRQQFSKQVELSVAYQALNSNNPGSKAGLFDGGYAALAQLAFKPVKTLDLGLTYVHTYYPGGSVNLTASTGSGFASSPFGSSVATSGDNFGLEAAFRPSSKFVISGWGGWTQATAEVNTFVGGLRAVKRGDTASVINWAVGLGFPDLGKKGNLLGFVFGMPPKVTDTPLRGQTLRNSLGVLVPGATKPNRQDKGDSYHIEGFYRYQVSDNISITPGAFVILNPENNNSNDAIWVGTIRTTFTF
jgi:hypothetical protein